jgi:uncharacterized membrane protein YbhN (UPF0104 family)
MNTRALPGAAAPSAPTRWSDRPWWPWLKRGLTLAFFLVVGTLAYRYARTVDWHQVWAALTGTPRHVLLAAVALAAASHALYSCFDLIGRHYTGHRVPVPRTMLVTFISYAFNLNMGTLVGGVAFRYRMYSRLGLDNTTITKVVTLSMLTNWLGYLLLAGLLFAVVPLSLPPAWKPGNEGLQWMGLLIMAAAAVYLGMCATATERSFSVRGHELMLPPPRMAALQMVVSCANWAIMGALIYTLLQGKVAYTRVLTVLLVAAVAGVLTHVPAGLGVLEAVFIALLSHEVPETQLLAALLGYRALYYIAPLLLALVLYVYFEVRARKTAAPQD